MWFLATTNAGITDGVAEATENDFVNDATFAAPTFVSNGVAPLLPESKRGLAQPHPAATNPSTHTTTKTLRIPAPQG